MTSRLDPVFLKSLRTLLPADSLLAMPGDTRRFASGGLSAYRAAPDVATFPQATRGADTGLPAVITGRLKARKLGRLQAELPKRL